MKHYTTVLTIAGSDPSGGAGIQADLKTISALGSYAATAITSLTVQNTLGVAAAHAVDASLVQAQIEAVMTDIHPTAVKIGMVPNAAIATVIAQCLLQHKPQFVVYDPVMVSSSGHQLMDASTIATVKEQLFPLVTLLTPNLHEAISLTGTTLCTVQDMERATLSLLALGPEAVLIKGGHLQGGVTTDVLRCKGGEAIAYHGTRTQSANTHGTGCTLSSAIATLLAQGFPLPQAVGAAKNYVAQAIAAGADVVIGQGCGPLNHLFCPQKMIINH